MQTRTQYGTRLATKPKGMLRQIIFPELALMGVKTGDGRLLEEEGGGVRELPLTIYGQFTNDPGHSGAVIIASLHEVTFDDGVASGSGWILDDANGRQAVTYIETQSLRGNSVDLADIKASFEWDDESDDILVRFTEWNIAATTLVGKPAFANARAELLEDEDLVASWMTSEEPLIVDVPVTFDIALADDTDLTADASPKPAWDLFHVPEPDKPQKYVIGDPDEAGYYPVWGHLGLWDSCHDGILGRCTRIPRPDDNYASFNKPGVQTDGGMVNTGPIFLTGGHRKGVADDDFFEAYGGTENVWADVHVVPGRLGPWMSGYVRPGTSEERIIAARASRLSGHWRGRRLKAVVCVNAEGFDVPGDGFASGGFAFSTDTEGHVSDLVASFPACEDTDPDLDDTDAGTAEDDTSDDTFTRNRLTVEAALQDMTDEDD